MDTGRPLIKISDNILGITMDTYQVQRGQCLQNTEHRFARLDFMLTACKVLGKGLQQKMQCTCVAHAFECGN